MYYSQYPHFIKFFCLLGKWNQLQQFRLCVYQQFCNSVAVHLICIQGTITDFGHVHGFPHPKSKNQSSQRLKGNCRHHLHQQHYSKPTDIGGICLEYLPRSLCCTLWPSIAGGCHTLPHTSVYSKGILSTIVNIHVLAIPNDCIT